MKKGECKTCECPSYKLIETISRKWVLMIIKTMCEHHKMRFSDIQKCLPDINSRILSARLSELEKEGFLDRVVEDSKPIAISYELTQKALDLKKVFHVFMDWAKKWAHKK